jgi:hypothetical protein
MPENAALVPVEQKAVMFYEDEVVAVLVRIDAKEEVFVPVRPLAERLGLSWSSQLRRLRGDAVLRNEVQDVQVETAGGPQTMPAIPLDFLQGWLFGINANRAKDEVRERLVRYQRECYRVLAEAFQAGELSTDPVEVDLLRHVSPATREAYEIARAVVRLARSQLVLEAHVNSRLEEVEERLENVEARLGSSDTVNEEQASQISQGVKAVALAMSKRSGRNEFGGVYGELYRRFGITSYKLLPASRFRDAMTFLDEWYSQVEGGLF